MSRFLCPVCLTDFQPVRSPLCSRCGAAFGGCEGDDHVCEACIRAPRFFHRARAAGMYEGSLRRIIQAFKFHARVHLAGPLGLLLLHAFRDMYALETLPESIPDTVVPVPLHAARQRRRGYNQAFLLTDRMVALNQRHPDPVCFTLTSEQTLLKRSRKTRPQTGLDKAHRKTNIAGAFRVDVPNRAAGRHILLVDDVYTTGATADECARILIQAGAGRVDVLTLARA